jgi:hypothetical protein
MVNGGHGDPLDPIELVRQDVNDGLRTPADPDNPQRNAEAPFTFHPTAIQIADQFGAMGNEQFSAVAWSVVAEHTGDFAGIDGTGKEVEIAGVTIVEIGASPEECTFRRYIDWTAVLAQLGATVNTRTTTSSPD